MNLALSSARRQRLIHAREFERMQASGIFKDEHVELIGGRLVSVLPRTRAHVGRVNWLLAFLNRQLRTTCGIERCQVAVQVQSSARFVEGSSPEASLTVPEPDLMLVPAPLAYAGGPYDPAETFLVIEVADSSLAHDLADKSRLYAALGVPLLWVVDLPNRRLHVLQRPDRDTATYAEASVYEGEETVEIGTLPNLAPIEAGELFAHMADG